MSIEFQCDACKTLYRVHHELAGKRAQCTCGAPIMIPELASEPNLQERNVLAALEQSGPTAASDAADAWKGWLPTLGKIGGGGLLGLFVGAKAMMRNRNQAAMSPTMRMLVICGAGVVGALGAMLLTMFEVARHRKAAGQPMPSLMRWYFANGFSSVLLWIGTAFICAIFLAAVMVM